MSAPPPHDPRDTERFEELLDRCDHRPAQWLPFDELSELGRLYRRHLARLARLRDSGEDTAMIRHLNALCVRAYTFLYVAPSSSRSARLFLLERLPDALARTWTVQVIAWLLLLAGMVLGGTLAWRDPDALHAFMPACYGYAPERVDQLVASPSARTEFFERFAVPPALNTLFGSSLFVHNTKVGLLSFATGILAGVPTVLLHLYNGILLGAFASIFLRDPWPIAFLAWILPHGIPELTAITLCCAAGLLLGGAVAAPGRPGRSAALREAMNPALVLFAASIPLFALAAVIESFVRESAFGTAARLGIAGALGAALVAALRGVRRLARHAGVDRAWLRELTLPAHRESPGSGSAPLP